MRNRVLGDHPPTGPALLERLVTQPLLLAPVIPRIPKRLQIYLLSESCPA